MGRRGIEICKRTITLKQVSVTDDPCGDNCNPITGRPCGGNCTFCQIVAILENACVGFSYVTNADISVRPEGGLRYTPSKNVQMSIISVPKKNKISIKTFKFTNLKNKNKNSFLVQTFDENGRVVNKRIPFSVLRKMERRARMKLKRKR
ncbi:hypothetical protein [Longirhabdus pacifica]|uniref:hypothetical protein n=1 Tax=Longirhabdus pacifica TaxID=2305227 RepID=UPI0010088DA3|nr:hypothetical protein [Longirhabdus pacifica]